MYKHPQNCRQFIRRLVTRALSLCTAATFGLAIPGGVAAEPLVTQGTRLAIVGDSITEQRLYSRFVEAWLLACSGIPDIRVMQFGWAAETAAGFAARAENDLAAFHPDVVTLCYGMNDGGYQPWQERIGVSYDANMRAVLERLSKAGVRRVVIGSPGAVDNHFFRPGQMMGDRPAHVAYNETLARLRDIDAALAKEKEYQFADVHAVMAEAMAKAQATIGPKYDVCGTDGVHPGPNGQLLMAYAFLDGLGMDGRIAEIDVDAAARTAKSSAGHEVKGLQQLAGGMTVELESRRWPFCFDGDSSKGTRSIVPFVPFNDRFNRFMLKVSGLSAPRVRVTWGTASREFTREQLAQGVNLAAEFPLTPFDEPFARLQAAITEKQAFETEMIKGIITKFRQIPGVADDPATKAATRLLSDRLLGRWEELRKKAIDRLVPVSHSLSIEPLGG